MRLSQEESLSLAEFVSSDARVLGVENALAAEVAATNADVTSIDTRAGGIESALAAEVAATNADVTSIDTRVAADEADLAALRSDFEWDSTNKHMIVGGYARVEFESGVASGDPMKITVKGK